MSVKLETWAVAFGTDVLFVTCVGVASLVFPSGLVVCAMLGTVLVSVGGPTVRPKPTKEDSNTLAMIADTCFLVGLFSASFSNEDGFISP